MKKTLIALLLALVMVLSVVSLAGCATEQPSGGDNTGDNAGDNTGDNTGDDGEDNTDAKDPVHLYWICGYTNMPTDLAIVEEKLHELSAEDIGIIVSTKYMDDETCKLAMTSGEEWDMTFTASWYNDFATQAQNGYFLNINGLVQEHAPNLYASLPEVVWEGASIGGEELYAIPVFKDYCGMQYILFPVEIVEALDLDIDRVQPDIAEGWYNFQHFADILWDHKEVWPEGTDVIFNVNRSGVVSYAFDTLINNTTVGVSYMDIGTPDEGKVKSSWEDPEYQNRVKVAHEMYEKGYITKDAAVLETVASNYSMLKLGTGFYGADAIWTANYGYEVVSRRYQGPYLYTNGPRGAMNAINADTQYPVECLVYQEYVNSDVEYRDTIRYGVQGYHWDYHETEGTVVVFEGSTDVYCPWAYAAGSYAFSTPTYPSEIDMWKVVAQDMAQPIVSPAFGFTAVIADIQNEIAAVSQVYQKYTYDLATGTASPDIFPTIIAEMYSAGMQTIIDEVQTQLDAFLGK